MRKLLYVPSGECILFISEKTLYEQGLEYSPDYDQSHWKSVWDESIEEVVMHFCNKDTEHETKNRHRIPIDVQLDPSEFEILVVAD